MVAPTASSGTSRTPSSKRPPPSASQKTESGAPFPVIDTSAPHSSLFIHPDTSGLTKREARLVKNRAAAFLSRQRKREQHDELHVKARSLCRLVWLMWCAGTRPDGSTSSAATVDLTGNAYVQRLLASLEREEGEAGADVPLSLQQVINTAGDPIAPTEEGPSSHYAALFVQSDQPPSIDKIIQGIRCGKSVDLPASVTCHVAQTNGGSGSGPATSSSSLSGSSSQRGASVDGSSSAPLVGGKESPEAKLKMENAQLQAELKVYKAREEEARKSEEELRQRLAEAEARAAAASSSLAASSFAMNALPHGPHHPPMAGMMPPHAGAFLPMPMWAYAAAAPNPVPPDAIWVQHVQPQSTTTATSRGSVSSSSISDLTSDSLMPASPTFPALSAPGSGSGSASSVSPLSPATPTDLDFNLDLDLDMELDVDLSLAAPPTSPVLPFSIGPPGPGAGASAFRGGRDPSKLNMTLAPSGTAFLLRAKRERELAAARSAGAPSDAESGLYANMSLGLSASTPILERFNSRPGMLLDGTDGIGMSRSGSSFSDTICGTSSSGFGRTGGGASAFASSSSLLDLHDAETRMQRSASMDGALVTAKSKQAPSNLSATKTDGAAVEPSEDEAGIRRAASGMALMVILIGFALFGLPSTAQDSRLPKTKMEAR